MTVSPCGPGIHTARNQRPSSVGEPENLGELKMRSPSCARREFPIPHDIGGRLTGVHV